MLQQELGVAIDSAMEAGKELRRKFGQAIEVKKKGAIDLVTEADLEAEKIILDRIRRDFPQDYILAEESGDMGEESAQRTWLVDPLDGTTNFAHGFPFFAVSIALEIDGDLVLGVVYNPAMEEMFQASKGAGVFLNGRPIKVSRTRSLEDSLLGTGFPYDIRERPERVIANFNQMLLQAQGVRRPGSAALDLCCVAAGRFDGFWEERLKPWDTAAGAVLVREAGGVVTTYENGHYSPYAKSIVAANPYIHRDLVRSMARGAGRREQSA